jgi:hypothetical protein
MVKGSVGVRALVVAKKRVMTVEQRGVGTWCGQIWSKHSTRVRVVPQGCSPGCAGIPGLKALGLSTVDRLQDR